MTTLVVYSPKVSARLFYVLDWVFRERLGLDYQVTDSEACKADVYYGCIKSGVISIPDVGLLWEECVDGRLPPTWKGVGFGEWEGVPCLGFYPEVGYTVPFDLLSATFWLLSRYEEYQGYEPDRHDRYPATESLLLKHDVLSSPIVDHWVSKLGKLLEVQMGIRLRGLAYSFRPSYDIDIAYSYRAKGLRRTVGGFVRDFGRGNLGEVAERALVLANVRKDPYDSFGWLRELHKVNSLDPLYFVLCALNTTPFDKNIHPRNRSMSAIIKKLQMDGRVGIHPSYFANEAKVLLSELRVLEHICGGDAISISRQHYIKLKVPASCRLLLDAGIADDFSMGYSTHLGFRAGTGSSFLWYDLLNERVTNLRMHPFCFMDTAALYELQLTPADAFTALHLMMQELKHVGSPLITVFHNFSLGSAPEWSGWSEAYRDFVAKARS